MWRSRYTGAPITGISKEQEAGVPVIGGRQTLGLASTNRSAVRAGVGGTRWAEWPRGHVARR